MKQGWRVWRAAIIISQVDSIYSECITGNVPRQKSDEFITSDLYMQKSNEFITSDLYMQKSNGFITFDRYVLL